MTIALLIQAVVRQTTILIAQLATSGHSRAPIAQVASQVFLELVKELERQGVSRKVSADMFGMGLRTYQRKIQRITESSTERGRSLWTALLDYVASRDTVSRTEVLVRFASDDEALVRSVLHDLCESELVTQTGSGANSVYRARTGDEMGRLLQTRRSEGLDELLWALLYHEGPLPADEVPARTGLGALECEAVLSRLLEAGRIEFAGGSYRTSSLVLPLGSPVGFEAAVFDHFKAVVNTLTGRLRAPRSAPSLADRVGGSTYSVEVWPGHPLEDEVYATLGKLRGILGDLRQRVESHNQGQPPPENHTKVLLYVGQCPIPQGHPSGEESDA
jgi:hypothetical protein